MFITEMFFNKNAYIINVNTEKTIESHLNDLFNDLKLKGKIIIDTAVHPDFCSISLANITISELKTIMKYYFPNCSVEFIDEDLQKSDDTHDHHNFVIMNENPDNKNKKPDNSKKQDIKSSDNSKKPDIKSTNKDITISYTKIISKLPKNIQTKFDKKLSEDQKSFSVFTVYIDLKKPNNTSKLKQQLYDKSMESLYGRLGNPFLFAHKNNKFYTKNIVNNPVIDQILLGKMVENGEFTAKDKDGKSFKFTPIFTHSCTNSLFSQVILRDNMIIGSLKPDILEKLKNMAKINPSLRIDLSFILNNSSIIHYFSVKLTDLDRDIVVCTSEDKEFLNRILIQLQYPLNSDTIIEKISEKPSISLIEIINFIILLIIAIYLNIRDKKYRKILILVGFGVFKPSISLMLLLCEIIICNPIIRGIIPVVIAPIFYKYIICNSSIESSLYTNYMIILSLSWTVISLFANKLCNNCCNNDCSNDKKCSK